jgi:hypothetical protein
MAAATFREFPGSINGGSPPSAMRRPVRCAGGRGGHSVGEPPMAVRAASDPVAPSIDVNTTS